VTSELHNDWLSGEIDFIKNGPSAGQGWSHGPGLSRVRNGPTDDEGFYVRGAQGRSGGILPPD